LASDIAVMNELIVDHLIDKEELIGLVGKYLIEAGGKRIRPILTILSSKMFNYSGDNNIKLATAVEFIHAATLLHDDVVDDGKIRRFKPTANIIWGNKASILVGDFLFSQAFKLMVAAKSIPALWSLSKASSIIASGEVTQLATLNQRRMITSLEYDDIITAKTAELFGASCEVGAIIAKQPKRICKIMRQFGIHLGSIFQIIDDLFDYCGNDGELGKNIGIDFLEGKVTLPLILLYESLKPIYQAKIREIIKADMRSKEDFVWVQNLLEQNNIKSQIMSYLDNKQLTARELLNKINIQNIYKDYLLSLLEFAITRSY
jgi:octaprenyl-diphosphate synthase